MEKIQLTEEEIALGKERYNTLFTSKRGFTKPVLCPNKKKRKAQRQARRRNR